MSSGTYRHPRADALECAEALRGLLAGAFEAFEVGGSARRGRPTVGDLELVIRPKREPRPVMNGPQASLFPTLVDTDITAEALDRLVSWASPERQGPADPPSLDGRHWLVARGARWGPKYRQLLVAPADVDRPALTVDVFLPPSVVQYGWILLLRTGSGAFNEWLIRRFKDRGVESKDGFLVGRDGERIPTHDEALVFETAGLAPVQPEARDVYEGESESEAFARWARGGA